MDSRRPTTIAYQYPSALSELVPSVSVCSSATSPLRHPTPVPGQKSRPSQLTLYALRAVQSCQRASIPMQTPTKLAVAAQSSLLASVQPFPASRFAVRVGDWEDVARRLA